MRPYLYSRDKNIKTNTVGFTVIIKLQEYTLNGLKSQLNDRNSIIELRHFRSTSGFIGLKRWSYTFGARSFFFAFWWLKSNPFWSYTFSWIIVYFQRNYRIVSESQYRRKIVYFPKNHNFGTYTIRIWKGVRNFATNSIWISIHFTTLILDVL